jgi:hypothetical protein
MCIEKSMASLIAIHLQRENPGLATSLLYCSHCSRTPSINSHEIGFMNSTHSYCGNYMLIRKGACGAHWRGLEDVEIK